MVDDVMVCVDRIMTSACFESANNEEGPARAGIEEAGKNFSANGSVLNKGDEEASSKKSEKGEMIECRICQEEDEEKEMEAPCGCSGTLKFAHRKCIQRWCNKKGDITCEICNQIFAPNYSLPPKRRSSDGMTIDIRHSWGTRLDVHDPFLALAAEHRLLQAEYEDYAAANTSHIACCRAVALILMLLLLVRHALLVTQESGGEQDASAFFNVSFLQFAGFLLPCCVMARVLCIVQSRRRRQG
ncbi:hypothetical protein AAC387_Pa12g1327 [Persea americana]